MQKHRFTTQSLFGLGHPLFIPVIYFSANGNFKTAKLAEKIA